jgi:hypothetical protein
MSTCPHLPLTLIDYEMEEIRTWKLELEDG